MKTEKPRSLREALQGKLTKREASLLVTSFDIIGSVAIIEIPPALKKKAAVIGQALLRVHKNVRTVCSRAGKHAGRYRVRAVRVIAGKRCTETLYKESGALMKLDVATTYFTPRLSHERQRIAEQVKPNEKVGVFFAGVGPFALVIAKRQPRSRVWAFELNPKSFAYLPGNVKLNKLTNVVAVKGDVKKTVPKCSVKFDRIVMPLPKGAQDFLDVAFKAAAKGCVVHFYQFAPEENLFGEAVHKLQAAARRHKRRLRVANKHVVQPFAPRVHQVVLDAKIAN